MKAEELKLKKAAQVSARQRVEAGELTSKAVVRKYHVLRLNCDCSCYYHAALRPPHRSGSFTRARCRECGKPLGDMEVEYRGIVYAPLAAEAILAAKSGNAYLPPP